MPANKQSPANPNFPIVTAMEALTEQLRRNLEYMQQAEHKAKTEPIRQQQDRQMPKPKDAPQGARQSQQSTLGEEWSDNLYRDAMPGAYRQMQEERLRQREREQDDMYFGSSRQTFGDTMRNFSQASQEARQKGASRLGGIAAGLRSFNQGGVNDPNASVPPNMTGSTSGAGGMGGSGLSGGGMGGGTMGNMGANDALTWAVLGEHGGPAFVRNLALESYGLQRSIGWAQQNAKLFSSQLDSGSNSWLSKIPGLNSSSMNALGGALNIAAKHPLATYAAYKAGRGFMGGFGKLSRIGQDWEQQGAALGVPTSATRYIAGIHVPWSPLNSDATSVGAGAAVVKRELKGQIPGGMGLGSGLSASQAQEIVNQIEEQGFGANTNKWGGGDISTIANQLMGPMLKQNPGLTGADVGQFLPALRQSGTSLSQLRTTLDDLGAAAMATHQTIGQTATSLADFGQEMEKSGLGSLPGALGLGQGFTSIFGLNPQEMGRIAQSPMFQGLMMSRNGILPSGIADVNPGAASTTTLAMLQMLQHMTAGFNRDKYTMVNGQRVLVQSGKQAQIDQIAQISGMDPTKVRFMLGDQHAMTARSQVALGLGSSTQGTGLYQFLDQMGKNATPQQQKMLQKYWSATIAPNLTGAGITKKQVQQLNQTKDWHGKAELLRKDMDQASGKSSRQAIQQHASQQTVLVKFTGAAAKIFQVAGPTTTKQAANTGKFAYSGVANSIAGDLSKINTGTPIDYPLHLLGDLLP